jgi:hypothetical protein
MGLHWQHRYGHDAWELFEVPDTPGPVKRLAIVHLHLSGLGEELGEWYEVEGDPTNRYHTVDEAQEAAVAWAIDQGRYTPSN